MDVASCEVVISAYQMIRKSRIFIVTDKIRMNSRDKTVIASLTPSLFWDTDIQELNGQKNAPFIVERVLQRGTTSDFKAILALYGRNELRRIIKNLRYLDRKTLHFVSVYFQIPLTEMRCYITRQSSQIHWDY